VCLYVCDRGEESVCMWRERGSKTERERERTKERRDGNNERDTLRGCV